VVQTGRANLSPITGVSLEYPYLHDAVDESFTALRQRVSAETGWDVFSSLQAAFLPVSQPPEAASEWDWLYTGRAILLNRLPQEVGWMAVAREDFGEQTYWRIFLRPLTQDGSQGSPQHARAWDLYARFHTNPGAYEHGGELSTSALDGYWVDLTEIANRYGWQRLSALPEWINYLPASRFGILVNAPGLSWTKAMLELYPSAVFPHTAPQKVDPGISTPVKTLPGPQPTLHPTWTPAP
jgi:TolB protein